MRLVKVLFACLVGLWLIGCALPLEAEQFVRVGVYEGGAYQRRDESGNYIGFNIDYLQELAKYAQWEYRFVECGSWENAYAKLQAGEIDLLPGVYRDREREDKLLFSALPLCYAHSALCVRADDNRFAYEDFEAISDMRVGVIRAGKDEKNFRSYCAENGTRPAIVPFGGVDALFQALESGSVDAAALTYLGGGNVRTVARFAVEPLYFVTAKQRPELMEALDVAVQKIQLQDFNYGAKLYEKYFSGKEQRQPVFSPKEQAFIREAKKVRVAYDAHWAPLEYADLPAGVFSGMAAELFKRIGEMSGLEFEYVPYEDYLTGLENTSVENGVDVLSGVSEDESGWGGASLLRTSCYLRAPVVLVRAGGGDRIAMPRGYVLSRCVAAERPGRTVLYFDSVKDCFDALARGEADVTYVNTHIANYLLANPRYERFSAVTLTHYVDEIAIGVSPLADPRLYSILDKCVQAVPGDQISEWILKNSVRPQHINWRDFFYQHSMEAVGVLTAIFFVVVMALLGFIFSKAQDHKRIRQLLRNDALTGAWNLIEFRSRSRRFLQAKEKRYALLYADISRFKDVNDLYGFSGGDEVLRCFAGVLAEAAAEDECSARVSSDQFVLLWRYESWQKLLARTEAIGREINALPLLRQKGCQLVLRFGVYVLQDEDRARDVSTLLDFARYAHQTVKETHRSVTVLYDEAMQKSDQEQRALAGVMERALQNGEFVPYFQPKVDMSTHGIVGAEALVRWLHPTRGLLLPGAFIPFFERNGFIVEIDFYVYEKVCESIRRWLDEGLRVRPISCNFSRLHVKNQHFVQRVIATAQRYCVSPDYIELEITESVVMDDPAQALQQFAQLRQAGFRVSIDDFGAGYSSLGMLQHLTADVLKLDRSLLAQGNLEKRRQAIIGGVVAMAKSLDMSVVCEGVENEQQADMLMGMGCFVAQSFYYGRPMPADAFERLLRADDARQTEA